MSAIERETSEYVEMSDSITLCIVKDGAAGTSINMKTGVSSPDALPSSGASIGDSYIIDGHLWTYTGGTASDATHRNGFTDCGKVSGEAGKNNYVHVAWSNKQNPTKDDIVLSNTDGNAYAYMGTWVSETKEDTADEAVKMAKWVYVKGDKGTPGKDAVTYGVQVTPYLDPLSSGKTDPGIQIQFTRTTGATVETFTNVTKLGGSVMVYVDGVYHVDATNWINSGNDKIVFSHFPIDNTSTDKTLGTASTIGIELLVNSTVVATASYANGKQGADGSGALEISVDPDTLVFDTDDDGIVPSETSKRATIACYRDGKKVTNVDYALMEGGHPDCDASISASNGTATVTISNIAKDEPYDVSKTSGTVEVQVYDKDKGRNYFPRVKFSVNVARYTGGLKADNKKFESAYNYLTNNGNSTDFSYYESKIRQTAKEISLKVSEKSVGRRNMLPGSAFRKGDDGFEMGIYGDFDGSTYTKGYHGNQGIFMNGGVSGSNFFRAKSYYDGSNPQYGGLFWRGGGASKNIKVQANKKYALSCWVKCDRTDVTISLETIYKASETTTTRQGRPFTTPNNFHVSKANTWQLISCIVTTDGSFNYVEVNFWVSHMINGVTATACFCHPMFEEAEEYNGWTLSELDYDYIGGNLIDNSRTFASGGNCNVHTIYGSVIANVYNSESSVFKARMEALAGSVPSKYSLPSSASSGTRYALDSDWSVWQYNGNSLSDDSHYNGWQKTNESLHQDIMLVNLNLELNKDYIISWYAKCEGNGFFGAYATDLGKTVYSEYSDGGIDQSTYGENIFFLTTQWKRFWMHVKLIKGSCSAIAFRQYRGDWSSGSSAMTVYFTQPKIEEGATVTDWTEKRTDMVDKRALFATGIDIENKKITLTANNTKFRDNDGNELAVIDQDGLRSSKIATTDTGHGHTVIEGNTTVWFQKDGKTPGIAVFYDAAGVPHLAFYGTDGKQKYDIGPSGLQSLISSIQQAHSDTAYLRDATSYVHVNNSTLTGFDWLYVASGEKKDMRYIYRKQIPMTDASAQSGIYDGCVFTKEYSGTNWPNGGNLLANGWYVKPNDGNLPMKLHMADEEGVLDPTKTLYYQAFYYYEGGKVARTVRAYMKRSTKSDQLLSKFEYAGSYDEIL